LLAGLPRLTPEAGSAEKIVPIHGSADPGTALPGRRLAAPIPYRNTYRRAELLWARAFARAVSASARHHVSANVASAWRLLLACHE